MLVDTMWRRVRALGERSWNFLSPPLFVFPASRAGVRRVAGLGALILAGRDPAAVLQVEGGGDGQRRAEQQRPQGTAARRGVRCGDRRREPRQLVGDGGG